MTFKNEIILFIKKTEKKVYIVCIIEMYYNKMGVYISAKKEVKRLQNIIIRQRNIITKLKTEKIKCDHDYDITYTMSPDWSRQIISSNCSKCGHHTIQRIDY